MTKVETFNPDAVRPPAGTYSHVARAPAGAGLVVIAGQVGIDQAGDIAGGDFDRQIAQVFANLDAALESAGAGWSSVIQTMCFLTRRQDVPAFREWRTREFARHFPDGRYPPSTLLIVAGLADEEMLIEVQAIAAI